MINVHVNVAGNFHMLITVVYSCSVAISSDKSKRVSSLLQKVFLHASASLLMSDSCSYLYQLKYTLVSKQKIAQIKKSSHFAQNNCFIALLRFGVR